MNNDIEAGTDVPVAPRGQRVENTFRHLLIVFMSVHTLLVIYGMTLVMISDAGVTPAVVAQFMDIFMCIMAIFMRIEHFCVIGAPATTLATLLAHATLGSVLDSVNSIYVAALVMQTAISILRVVYMMAIMGELWQCSSQNCCLTHGGLCSVYWFFCRGPQSIAVKGWEKIE